MTKIERKALAYACECAGRALHHFDRMGLDLPLRASIISHARAIEQHEAFRREVSDAVEDLLSGSVFYQAADARLRRFIIAKPDPLVEALEEASGTNDPVEWANRFYAAIEKRGGKIVWGEKQ